MTTPVLITLIICGTIVTCVGMVLLIIWRVGRNSNKEYNDMKARMAEKQARFDADFNKGWRGPKL